MRTAFGQESNILNSYEEHNKLKPCLNKSLFGEHAEINTIYLLSYTAHNTKHFPD
jgi:hypothetical protein